MALADTHKGHHHHSHHYHRFMDSSGKVIKIRPLHLRSSSAPPPPSHHHPRPTQERVSTDTSRRSVKQTTTVLTSRLAGQRIINRNTTTRTTTTNSHGVVVTERPQHNTQKPRGTLSCGSGQKCLTNECSGVSERPIKSCVCGPGQNSCITSEHSGVTERLKKHRSYSGSGQIYFNVDNEKVFSLEGLENKTKAKADESSYYGSNSSSSSCIIPARSLKKGIGKSPQDRINKELKDVGQQRLVGNISKLFEKFKQDKYDYMNEAPTTEEIEDKNKDIMGCKPAPRKTIVTPCKIRTDSFKSNDSKTSANDRINLLEREYDNAVIDGVSTAESRDEIVTNRTGNDTADKRQLLLTDYEPYINHPSNIASCKDNLLQPTQLPTTAAADDSNSTIPSKSKTYMNTYTFSIPQKSSLFQVSSKELKAILDSSAELSFFSSPSGVTKLFVSKEEKEEEIIRPDSTNTATTLHHQCPPTGDSAEAATCTRWTSLGKGENRITATTTASGQHGSSPLMDTATAIDTLLPPPPAPATNHDSVRRPLGMGLDYGRIWGSTLRDVAIKPRRQVYCYRDYLDDNNVV